MVKRLHRSSVVFIGLLVFTIVRVGLFFGISGNSNIGDNSGSFGAGGSFGNSSAIVESSEISIFEIARKKFFDGLSFGSSTENLGLGYAYLLGDKKVLPDGLLDKVKIVGMTHVLVVSGAHLGIIISFSRKIFGKISRLISIYFSIFLLFLYIFLVGLSPSLVRAGISTIFGLFAWYFGRKISGVRMFFYVLCFSLLIFPEFLTNISWQLSILAYSGVILVAPIFRYFLYGKTKMFNLYCEEDEAFVGFFRENTSGKNSLRKKILKKISSFLSDFLGESMIISVATFITCTPISLYYFGSVSLLSFVANLVILPTLPLAMGVTFVVGIFGMFGVKNGALSLLMEKILVFHVGVIDFLSTREEFFMQTKKGRVVVLLSYVIIFAFVAIFYGRIYALMSKKGQFKRKIAKQICDFAEGSNKLTAFVQQNIEISNNNASDEERTSDRFDKANNFETGFVEREKEGNLFCRKKRKKRSVG